MHNVERLGEHVTAALLDRLRVASKAFRDCELVLRPSGRTDGAHGSALAARNASPVQAGRQHRSLRLSLSHLVRPPGPVGTA
jgi:hypothetical protein